MQSTLVECGWGVTRKKDGYLKRKYESLVVSRGKKKALVTSRPQNKNCFIPRNKKQRGLQSTRVRQ